MKSQLRHWLVIGFLSTFGAMFCDIAGAEDDAHNQLPAFKAEVSAVIQALTGKISRKGEFTAARYDQLAEALEQAQEDEAGKQLLKNAQDFARGKIEEDLFVTYLESKLKKLERKTTKDGMANGELAKLAGPSTSPVNSGDNQRHVADQSDSNVVARIGKIEIKLEQLEPAVNTFIKQFNARGRSFPMEQLGRLRYDVLDEMVTRELVLQQTVGHEPTNLAAQVQELIETSKTQAGSPEAYAKAVADLGVTPEEYAKRVREMILIQETIKQVVESKIKVTAEDCKKFYDENPSKFILPNHGGVRAYANARADIETYLKKQQTEQLAQQYFKGLRDKVKVEIFVPEPPPIAK